MDLTIRPTIRFPVRYASRQAAEKPEFEWRS
jgi:hypothetical protein